MAANLDALRLLRVLDTERRPATVAEQKSLARWSGWGAVPAIFDDHDDRYAAARSEIRALVSDKEWDAAQRTVLNAHYTDPAVVAAMWVALGRLGFEYGRVLEPAAGRATSSGSRPPGRRWWAWSGTR